MNRVPLSCLVWALVSRAAAATVGLIWDPNPEPDVVEYRVHVGTVSRAYGVTYSSGINTTFTVPELQAGQTYFLAVTARNEFGLESEYSEEVVYTVPPDPPAPPNPTALILADVISWRYVTNRTGAVTPILIVPGNPGVSVKASVITPAGVTTRERIIDDTGVAEFQGKPTARPFVASGQILAVTSEPGIVATSTVE